VVYLSKVARLIHTGCKTGLRPILLILWTWSTLYSPSMSFDFPRVTLPISDQPTWSSLNCSAHNEFSVVFGIGHDMSF
ncbi:hypothetical protein TorRG33x02_268290, partial [Trema orientale]